MQHRGHLIASALILGAGLLAACGGSESQDKSATVATGTPPAATASGTGAAGSATRSTETTATATGSPSAAATGSASAPAGTPTATATASQPPADAAKAFMELAKDRTGETVSIRYAFTAVEGGERRTGAWKIAQDPPKSLVYIAYDASAGGEFWVIDDGKSAVVCFATAAERGQCIKTGDSSTADSLVPPVADVDESFDSAEKATNIREVGGRTIAGRPARCFEYDAEGTEDDGTICLDSGDGTMLYLSRADVELTATEVTRTVPAGTFEPPFAVLDVGG